MLLSTLLTNLIWLLCVKEDEQEEGFVEQIFKFLNDYLDLSPSGWCLDLTMSWLGSGVHSSMIISEPFKNKKKGKRKVTTLGCLRELLKSRSWRVGLV